MIRKAHKFINKGIKMNKQDILENEDKTNKAKLENESVLEDDKSYKEHVTDQDITIHQDEVENDNQPENKNKEESKKKNIIKEVISWIKLIAVALIIAWVINNFVVVNATIPSASMEDTILVGDRIYAFRLSYLFKDPQRGDIIVFPFPDNEEENYIKRIIGLPGETVEGIDGVVYIDGKVLEETYIKDQIEQDFGPFTVPEDSYFMMGDYRTVSADSRFWEHPFVEKDKILGKAVLKYYPKIKLIK